VTDNTPPTPGVELDELIQLLETKVGPCDVTPYNADGTQVIADAADGSSWLLGKYPTIADWAAEDAEADQ
jgi:hypothetical protein